MNFSSCLICMHLKYLMPKQVYLFTKSVFERQRERLNVPARWFIPQMPTKLWALLTTQSRLPTRLTGTLWSCHHCLPGSVLAQRWSWEQERGDTPWYPDVGGMY